MRWPWQKKSRASIGVSIDNPPESIPVVAPEDTTDPLTYSLMSAMRGEPSYIYQDDDGVWRDAEDQPIPNLNR